MSSFPLDIVIWLLLFAGFVFGVLGFFGLLIFPDIKSRMFTASRATLIASGLVIATVILFSLNAYIENGQEIYLSLLVRTALLAVILVAGTIVITRIIRSNVAETIPPLEIRK